MAESNGKSVSKIQQVLDLVTRLDMKFQLMAQEVLGIKEKHSEQGGLIKALTKRLDCMEKDFIKHEAEHETREKSKSSNFRWVEIITPLLVVALMVLEFIK